MYFVSQAFNEPNVVVCCCKDALKQMIPYLNEQLELCQQSLTGYLEAKLKHSMFSRFYFVSDPVLLEIRPLGSNPEAIIPNLPAMLDSVYGLHLISMMRFPDMDLDISENLNIQATGNVEDCLGGIVMGMRMTISVLSLEDFIVKYPAQVALQHRVLALKRTLLTPKDSPGSRYRCGKSTFF